MCAAPSPPLRAGPPPPRGPGAFRFLFVSTWWWALGGMCAAPTPTLAYGPTTAPGTSRSTNPRPPRNTSFSERGDSPAKPSTAQYGSISHDGRKRYMPSLSSTPAENDRPTLAYATGEGPRIAPLIDW